MAKKNTNTLAGLQHALTEAAAAGVLHKDGDEPTGSELFRLCECDGPPNAALSRALKAAFSAAQELPTR